jgi:uncharacterized protein YjbI with pentapeptide repeats
MRLSDAWNEISMTEAPFSNQTTLFKLYLLPGVHSLDTSVVRTCIFSTQCKNVANVMHEPKMNGSFAKITQGFFISSHIAWKNGPPVSFSGFVFHNIALRITNISSANFTNCSFQGMFISSRFLNFNIVVYMYEISTIGTDLKIANTSVNMENCKSMGLVA